MAESTVTNDAGVDDAVTDQPDKPDPRRRWLDGFEIDARSPAVKAATSTAPATLPAHLY